MTEQPPHNASADEDAAVDAAAAEPADAATHDVAEPTDTKARFREALERKKQRETSGGNGVFGDSKIAGAHSAAGSRRVFRRKSG